MKGNFFAVDLGASSGRTILGTFADGGLRLEVVGRFPNHLIEAGGHYYWDIYELYRNILCGLRQVRDSGREIDSVGIDTWGVDFVAVGGDGGLLRQPYSYRDPHTDGAPERFFRRIPRSEVYGRTGIQVMNFNTLFQLDTLRRAGDSALAAADKILFTPDALSYMLTGETVTEYTIASTSQLLNARTGRFDPELLHAVGLTEANFGRFVMPGTAVGVLSGDVRRITGLGSVPVIAVAGHDTASAVAAVPATDPDFAYLSSGTWSLMGIETRGPIITPESQALNFTNEGGVDGTILFLKNICGMWLLERCRANWGDADYSSLTSEAAGSEPFRSLINPDDPAFANPDDMELQIRRACIETCQSEPQTRGQIVRCIFDSLALRYRQVIDDLRKLSSRPVNVLHVIGGGSRNDLLNQFTANAVGVPVVAGPSEATAIGNIMIQAMAACSLSGAASGAAAVSGTASESGADSCGAAPFAPDIAGMRRLIARSVPLKTYLPRDGAVWEAAYARFKGIFGGAS